MNHLTDAESISPKKPKMELQEKGPIISTNRTITANGKPFTIMPIQSVWTDHVTTEDCLSVAILLPFSVRPRDVLSLRVMEGGRELEI